MKKGQLSAVLLIIAIVAAVGAFFIFSDKQAGQAVRLTSPQYQPQPTQPPYISPSAPAPQPTQPAYVSPSTPTSQPAQPSSTVQQPSSAPSTSISGVSSQPTQKSAQYDAIFTQIDIYARTANKQIILAFQKEVVDPQFLNPIIKGQQPQLSSITKMYAPVLNSQWNKLVSLYKAAPADLAGSKSYALAQAYSQVITSALQGLDGPVVFGTVLEQNKNFHDGFKKWITENKDNKKGETLIGDTAGGSNFDFEWDSDGNLVWDLPWGKECVFKTHKGKESGRFMDLKALNGVFKAYVDCSSTKWEWVNNPDLKAKAQAIFHGNAAVLTGHLADDDDDKKADKDKESSAGKCKEFLKNFLMPLQELAFND